MIITDEIKKAVSGALNALGNDVAMEEIALEHPTAEEHGDYSTNIALKLKVSAQKIADSLPKNKNWTVSVAGQFINFSLAPEWLVENLNNDERNNNLKGKKIMMEFAHPNTHKQFHIGHLRNITIGESLVRLLENSGAKVVRTNYQGDVGMHVAKALWGIKKLGKVSGDKVAFLAKAYVLGTKSFEEDEAVKKEIVELNKKIYQKDPQIMPLWLETRQWSLDYFDKIYKRVYTHFDRLYFESEVADRGKELVLKNVGKVFEESEGAIIFRGEHTRVFVNSEGNPTYEAKDMGLGELQFKEYDPDLLIHNLGPEQWGYTRVMFEALAQLFPETRGRELHLTYGWVKLKEGKMSSRMGNVVLGEWLVDEIKKTLGEKYPDRMSDLEPVAIAAVKYSLLKVGSNTEIAFDIDESISLEGDSGPYLQYTFARAQSVLRKSLILSEQSESKDLVSEHSKVLTLKDIDSPMDSNSKQSVSSSVPIGQQDPSASLGITTEELAILRWIYRFPEVVEMAAKNYAPNLVCSYLFELAKRFNNFYNNVPILGPLLRASPSASGLNNFLDNVEWMVKNIHKDNYENYPDPVPVGRLTKEISRAIGAKNETVFLKPWVYAKIEGWLPDRAGHKEIEEKHFLLLPKILEAPSRILKDKRSDSVFHFVVDLPKSLDVVVDVFYRNEDFVQISSIYFTRRDYLKNFEEIVLGGGAAVSPFWSTLADSAGSRLSSLHQNQAHLSKSSDKNQVPEFRLLLTATCATVLKNGLNLLGIEALERM